MSHTKHNSAQSGLASIVVVFILAIIISLVSVGFSRLMDRAIQEASGNDLNAAADYAARSAVNEVAAYLKQYPDNGASSCDELTKQGAPFARLTDLSGNGDTKYTCLLINPSPTDIYYQILTPYKSQVTKLQPSNNIDQMMVSWQASDRRNNQFPKPNSQLLDEKSWSDKRYAPLLRLTIYPLPDTNPNNKSDDRSNWLYLTSHYKTFFLMPSANNPAGDPSANITKIDWATATDGTLVRTTCGTTKNDANFVGTTDYDCNLLFINMPNKAQSSDGNYTYYGRITPLYDSGTNVRIQAMTAGQLVKFKGTQDVIDVTAKAGNSVRRLQARVNIVPANSVDPQLHPSEDAIPEYGLRTADAICKRFLVPNDNRLPVSVDTNDPNYADACPVQYDSAN